MSFLNVKLRFTCVKCCRCYWKEELLKAHCQVNTTFQLKIGLMNSKLYVLILVSQLLISACYLCRRLCLQHYLTILKSLIWHSSICNRHPITRISFLSGASETFLGRLLGFSAIGSAIGSSDSFTFIKMWSDSRLSGAQKESLVNRYILWAAIKALFHTCSVVSQQK